MMIMRLIWGSRRVFGTALPRNQPYEACSSFAVVQVTRCGAIFGIIVSDAII
jgi:hypothetical protein